VAGSDSVNAEPTEDVSDDEEAVADGDLSSVKAGWTEPCKLVRSLRFTRRYIAHQVLTGADSKNGLEHELWQDCCSV
jgi:hypothetical protein